MAGNVNPEPYLIRPDNKLIDKHPRLKQAANQLALKYMYRRMVTEEELCAYGSELWQALGLADNGPLTKQGIKIQPVVVESSDPAIQQLPWELLHHPRAGFLGREKGYALSRCLGVEQAAAPDLQQGPLRVLLLTSRWQLPGWPEEDHLSLVHAGYGDFLRMARQQRVGDITR